MYLPDASVSPAGPALANGASYHGPMQRGKIGDGIMRAVQRGRDLELLLRSPDPVREPPPEVMVRDESEDG